MDIVAYSSERQDHGLRLLMAIIQFVLAGILWFFMPGWIIHLWSILDAARFNG